MELEEAAFIKYYGFSIKLKVSLIIFGAVSLLFVLFLQVMLGLDADGSTMSQIADGFGETLYIEETPGVLDCNTFRFVSKLELDLHLLCHSRKLHYAFLNACKLEQELHSSRMHTARLLTVSPSMHCAGGGSALPGGCLPCQGGSPCHRGGGGYPSMD